MSQALYPPSKATSSLKRIKVPACEPCNKRFMDAEPHFRNILLVAGETNAAVRELWEGKARRSFTYADGKRRTQDVVAQMVSVQTVQGERHMVYPGKDERVMLVVRKVIRGMCHHHSLLSPVSDGQVWADVQKFEVPPAFLDEMDTAHAEEDILKYRYGVISDPHIHSSWLLTFYERTTFFGIVFRSEEARLRVEAETRDATQSGSEEAP